MVDFKYKLSIIIPMYNAEKYIGKCLDSIFASDLPKEKYEILIVNDGSIDRSADIVNGYLKYPQIHLLEQENLGQSSARNNGLKNCRGEYVWFVDADDYLESSLSSIFNSLLEGKKLDILAIQLKKVNEQGKFLEIECSQPNVRHHLQMTGREAIISGYNPSSVCALITRRDFLVKNELYFYVGITHQDVELSYRMFVKAHNVIFINFSPYIYVQHPDSTSHSINTEKRIKYLCDDCTIIKSFQELASSIDNKDTILKQTIEERLKNIQLGLVLNLWNHRNEWGKRGINRAVISHMRTNGLYPLKGDFGSWKKNLLSFLLNVGMSIV
ncbi:MAG: glycosyltransferase [Prevotella sp.]|nr:glycosyltransferase [Prevotella sp.]